MTLDLNSGSGLAYRTFDAVLTSPIPTAGHRAEFVSSTVASHERSLSVTFPDYTDLPNWIGRASASIRGVGLQLFETVDGERAGLVCPAKETSYEALLRPAVKAAEHPEQGHH